LSALHLIAYSIGL